MELAEAFNFRHWQVVAAHMQPGVKKHAAMPGRQHKVIAANPTRLVRIMFERVTIEHRAHFGATEREPEMPGLRRLHRVHAQTARLRRGTRQRLNVQTHEAKLYDFGFGMESEFASSSAQDRQFPCCCSCVVSCQSAI